jgi:hypothetical protein
MPGGTLRGAMARSITTASTLTTFAIRLRAGGKVESVRLAPPGVAPVAAVTLRPQVPV